MNAIQQQSKRALMRLVLQRFGYRLTWSLFGCLLVAVIGLLIPKIVATQVNESVWLWAWVGGGVGVAVLLAAIMTWWGSPDLASAAQEVDKRFGLRERLSSAIMLPALDRDTASGRALVQDAERRAQHLEIAEQFPIRGNPVGLLPLLPMVMIFALLFVPNAADQPSPLAEKNPTDVTQVKNATEQLKKQLEQRRRAAEAKGLEEAGDLFKEIESGLDKMRAKEGTDRKQALIKLNDLKEQLEKRRDELGGSEQMKNNLSALKDLEQGPADKAAKDIEKGNFGDASEQMRALAKQLKDGDLSPEQQKQLQKQAEQMQKQIQEMVERHEQAKSDLERQVDQAKRDGDLNQAAKLQEKLQQLRQQDNAIQKLQKMSDGLGKAAESMKKGDAAGAAAQLDQMADQLGEMQAEMEQLEDLESALDQFEQAKESMRCQGCKGDGCAQCQGGGDSDEFNEKDWGKGKGRGAGKRDLAEDETNNYQSQVRDKPREGKAVASGFAAGPNRKGVTQEEVKGVIQSAIKDDSDPLEDRPLPRTERDHTREYFDQLREGNP